MSKARYASLKRQGLGPVEFEGIISPAAEAEWDARAALKGAETRLAAREAKARQERARAAGKRSAEKRNDNQKKKQQA
jgi:hypothetical protein